MLNNLFEEKFGISKSAAHQVYQNYVNDGTLNAKPKTGRPAKITHSDKRLLIQNCRLEPTKSSKELAKDFNIGRESPVSVSSIR